MLSTGIVKRVLHGAADILRRDGWTQGSFHEHETVYNEETNTFETRKCDGYCLMGAVYRASGHIHDEKGMRFPEGLSGESMVELETLERATEMVLSAYLRDFPTRWNDSSNRTKEEVIAALDECATKL